MPPLV